MSNSKVQFQYPTSPLKSKFFSEAGDPSVVKWDVLPVSDGEKLTIVFETVSPLFRHGVWLRCDEGIEIGGITHPQVTLWADTAPPRGEFICHTTDGQLHLYNVWDIGRGRESQGWRSGMRVEPTNDGYRYRCTGTGREINFNSLILRIIRS